MINTVSQSGRLPVCGLVSVVALFLGCSDETICYASSQSDVNEMVDDTRCSSVFLADYPEREVRAASVRDVELVVTQTSSALRHMYLDHVVFGGSVQRLESLHIVDYQGGPVSATDLLDVEIGADVPEVRRTFAFNANNSEGVPHSTIRVRASGSMDGWIVRPEVAGSWENVTLEIDPSAQPTSTLELQGAIGADMRLDQMQAFGARMTRIEIGYVFPEETRSRYIDWLEAEGFAGVLFLLGENNQRTALLPR